MRYLLDDKLSKRIAQWSDDGAGVTEALLMLSEVATAINEQDDTNNDPRRDAAISAARERTDDELEIDDEPELSPSDEGVWVSAWVWVSNLDIGITDEEENP